MEPMDTSELTFGIGRGRGLRRQANKEHPLRSPPKVAATDSNKVDANQSVRPKETTSWTPSTSRTHQSVQTSPAQTPNRSAPTVPHMSSEEKKKRAVERSGIPQNFFSEYFKLDGDMNQFKDVMATPNYNWHLKNKEPDVKEEKEEKKETKYRGLQYVTEAKEKERQRVMQVLREEKDSNSRNQSPDLGQTSRRVDHNVSTLSLQTSLSTNIESVGTYQPLERMDVIAESEDEPQLIEKYFKVKPRRQKLPISEYEDKILKAVLANRVVIIEGSTGCGKTTQVPQYIADDCAAKGVPFNIVVTQPRRIAAQSIAKRVAQERDWQLGTIIGYQIGMDKSTVNEETRLLYCTTGVLLQKLINQQKLDNYSHIIIDEVHERSIETDLLLLVIKKLISTRSQSVKIILMSATFDVTELLEYFSLEVLNQNNDEFSNRVTPTHINIVEKPHKLHTYYLEMIKKELNISDAQRDFRLNQYHPVDPADKDVACVTQEAMDVAMHVLERGLSQMEKADNVNTRGSVLVFLPGLEEIHELKARMDKSPEKNKQQWLILPLHSTIPLEKQNLVFETTRGRERKIILATNIAESSITVPDVQFVIDFCLTKNLVMDVETHIPVLKLEWASKANCDQRAGRAGRCAMGRVYRLVTTQFHRKLPKYSQPELNRSPLDLSILRVKMLNMGPPKDLLGLAITPPNLADIYNSVLQLKQVGAFAILTTNKGRVYYEEEDGDLTILGRLISHLPIDIRLGKLICLGHVFDVLMDCIIIAACLSTQGMFRRDFAQGLNAYKSRLAWADRSFSDSIAHLNAYKTYKKFSAEFENDRKMAENWCKQNYIQYKRIREVDYMIGEIVMRLNRENIEVRNRPNLIRNRHEEELILKVVMCAAFYPQYFTREELDLQRIPKDLCSKDPLDSVLIQGLPPKDGPLYTHSIRDMFSICSKRIDISFEDTKAYLTFLDDKHPLKEAFDLHIPDKIKKELITGSNSSLSSVKSEDRFTPNSDRSSSMQSSLDSSNSAIHRLTRKDLKETAIKTAVYVAVAMRQHREINKEIPKLNEEVAAREMKSLEKFQSDEQKRKLTFNSKRLAVPHVLTRMKLTRLPLPALDCSEIEIRITHIESPSLFYAQYSADITTGYLNELSGIIAYEDYIVCQSETIQIGDIVIGELIQSDGGKMHGRARIDYIEYYDRTKEVERVTVFFIDYGVTKVIDNLKELSILSSKTPQRLYDIPPQAFRCALSGVNPSPIICGDRNWSKMSIEYFKKFVAKSRTLTAKIYSVFSRVVRLELFDNINREESFNDLLITIGHAEKWEESGPSKLNHDHRRKAQLSRNVSQSGLTLEKLDQPGVYDPDDVVELEIKFNPNERSHNIRTHDKILIKGPYSPLECRFTGVCQNTSHRSVTIDKSSVNCVVLEPDYLSKHTRLLVASSMGLTQNSGNITLRNTTLMPNIKGFPALMALLFAPRVQLKANKDKTEYVGAICGLGYNKQMKSYDQQYDAQIIFDSEISLEDMAKINIIRFNISSLLKSRESLREFTENSLAIKQRKIRRNMIELLDRRRRLLDTTTYPILKWSDITENDINSDLRKSEADINAELLPLCQMERLVQFDYFKDIEENLNDLKNLSEGGVSKTTKCKLCKYTAYTRPDVSNHLVSDQHMDNIKDFDKQFKLNIEERKKQDFYRQRLEEDIDDEDIEIFDVDSDEDISIIF